MEDIVLKMELFDTETEKDHSGTGKMITIKGQEIRYRGNYCCKRKDLDTGLWEDHDLNWDYSYRLEDLISVARIKVSLLDYWYVQLSVLNDTITVYFKHFKDAKTFQDVIRSLIFERKKDAEQKK